MFTESMVNLKRFRFELGCIKYVMQFAWKKTPHK